MSFTIHGHDLSYFSSAANGWTLPDGRFSVYVGDSSAPASLRLRGGFAVTKTIGLRYAQLTAPATVPAGVTFTATARFVDQGNIPIADGSVHLRGPGGMEGPVPVARRATLSLPAGESPTRELPGDCPRAGAGQHPDAHRDTVFSGHRRRGRRARDDDDPGAARDYREVTYDGGRRSGAATPVTVRLTSGLAGP